MTDEQIIKALKCCIESNSPEECSKCPLKRDNGNMSECLEQKERLSFDLINRQKSEIEELKTITGIMNTRKYYRKFVDEVFEKEMGNMRMSPDFDYIYELYFKQRAEIEELKAEANRWQNAFCRANEDIQTAKSEAIKEFAERLCKGRVENDPVVVAVKSELKEMEDGNNV